MENSLILSSLHISLSLSSFLSFSPSLLLSFLSFFSSFLSFSSYSLSSSPFFPPLFFTLFSSLPPLLFPLSSSPLSSLLLLLLFLLSSSYLPSLLPLKEDCPCCLRVRVCVGDFSSSSSSLPPFFFLFSGFKSRVFPMPSRGSTGRCGFFVLVFHGIIRWRN